MRVSVATGNFIQKSGDSMTGRLRISTNNEPVLVLDDPTAADILRMEGTLASVAKYYLAYNPSTDEFSLENGAVADKVGWTVATGSQVRGIVPLARMQAEEQSAENAGAVTLLVGATAIATLASMNVVAGDRILVAGLVAVTKGATTGLIRINVTKSAGTATIVWGVNKADLVDERPNILNGSLNQFALFGICEVTGTGTLTLQLAGLSAGSNSTVAIGDGDLYALRLVGV